MAPYCIPTTLPTVLLSSLIYLTLFLLPYLYTHRPTSYPLPSSFRTLITINSHLYSTFCFLYLLLLLNLVPLPLRPSPANLRLTYHATKLYEYLDVPLVLLTASRPGFQPIDLHFFVHHLTTPYYTYIRVLPLPPASDGWRVFPVLNKAHHALMYSYFGGVWGRAEDRGRPVLQATGIVQLLGGIVGDMWILWGRRGQGASEDEAGGEDWRNYAAISILSLYLVLLCRDTRIKERMRRNATVRRNEAKTE